MLNEPALMLLPVSVQLPVPDFCNPPARKPVRLPLYVLELLLLPMTTLLAPLMLRLPAPAKPPRTGEEVKNWMVPPARTSVLFCRAWLCRTCVGPTRRVVDPE